MHIGIDARLPAFRTGGISEYVLELISELALMGNGDRFTIFHAAHDRILRHPIDAPNMARADLLTPCHHRMERVLLAAELKPFALDVFHSPDFIPPALAAVRRIATVHDLSFLSNPEHIEPESLRHYAGQIAWAVEAADWVTASSEHTHQDIVARFPAQAAKVVTVPLAAGRRYHPAHNPAEMAATLERYGVAPGYVLFVGTIEPRKNLGTLVRAVEQLSENQRTAPPLVIAGDKGWLCEDVLEVMDRSHATVRRLGLVPADDLAHLYAAAGVLAVPSITEGFGLPVLEAMQTGCPVVASRGGALPETAGGAAVLVDPLDVPGWINALSRVLADPKLRKDLRDRGIARAQQFSWSKTAESILALYRKA